MSVLARTDPDSKRHHGISCFLVPLDRPGIQMLPLHNMAGGQQTQTYFEDVRLPLDCLLGAEGHGWKQVWLRQGGEIVDPSLPSPDIRTFRILQMLKDILAYCRSTPRNGRPLAEDPVVKLQLAELILGVEVIKLHAYEAYDDAARPASTRQPALAYYHQTYLKEFWPRLAQTCMEIVGPMAMISGGRWAQLEGRIEHYFRSSFANHAGGTSQVKRFMVATRGLGLPR
jgi:alkylation response protein AidB-like acyl-CoA dehydrogenase